MKKGYWILIVIILFIIAGLIPFMKGYTVCPFIPPCHEYKISLFDWIRYRDNLKPRENRENYNYVNSEYNFQLTLPASWKGFTVILGTVQFGETVTLRHPNWSKENPYMDIPILVYPIEQWKTWEANNFKGYLTAAPIGPTERGRNARYVFATAPRYNYSFETGWEAVDTIVESLKGF